MRNVVMGQRALITGVTGQDGAYLAKLLLEKGYEVHGTLRRNSQEETTRLNLLRVLDDVHLHNVDLAETSSIFRLLKKHKFDEIYNLAAQSFVGSSWDTPLTVSDVNAIGPLRILDTIVTLCPETKFYQASTSEMFGLVREMPQRETTPFYPRSPYGVAKLFAHAMTVNYRESHGLFACSGILFNHESPLRGSEFVTKKICATLARILKGSDEIGQVGNLAAKRDWGYAADYVEGMWAMLNHSEPDDYVLATGNTVSIRGFITHCAEASSLDIEFDGEGIGEKIINKKDGKVLFESVEKFYRPAEVEVLLGDATKASNKLGWKPKTNVRELASIMMRYEMTGEI